MKYDMLICFTCKCGREIDHSKKILLFCSLWVCKCFIITRYSSMSVCFTNLIDSTSLIRHIHLHLWAGPSGSRSVHRNYTAAADAEWVKSCENCLTVLSRTTWWDRKELFSRNSNENFSGAQLPKVEIYQVYTEYCHLVKGAPQLTKIEA